ncbi:MAG: hypothetical protein P8Z80_17955 [Pseudolabrys sp.]
MIRNGLLGLALAVALTAATHAQAAGNAGLVKRGDYPVTTIMTCGHCRTPHGPKGPIMAKTFSGGLSWDEPPFKVTASNITPDKETGLGNWTDAEIKRAITKGVDDEGKHLKPPMGFAMYDNMYDKMTSSDIDDIIARLRTLPAKE